MAAREVAVGALGTVYTIEGGKEAANSTGQVLADKWSLATAFSLLAWFVFAPQCASTLAVIRRETGGSVGMITSLFCESAGLQHCPRGKTVMTKARTKCGTPPDQV